MDNKINLKNIKAWPFVEAFKILKKLKTLTPLKLLILRLGMDLLEFHI